MGSYSWIKLYLEVLDDPKVARLNDHLWRRFFEVCMLAATTPERDGGLPPVFDMAWKLRTDEDVLTHDLEALARAGLLDFVQAAPPLAGYWLVTNFAKRQAAITTSERQEQHRERKRAEAVTNMSRNVTQIKNKSQNKNKDSEEDKETEAAAAPRKNVFSWYEQNIGPLTPILAQHLDDAESEYTEAWVYDAIQEAVKHGARNWSYVAAVLKSWKANGRDKRQATPARETVEQKRQREVMEYLGVK